MSMMADGAQHAGERRANPARWLSLAASPSFAAMAWVAAQDAARMPICAAMPGALPIDGMALMYLLMSLFHLAPWLSLGSSRPIDRSTHH